MPSLIVTKYKGGSSASTLTRELAVVAAADGLKVGLIDLDGQGGTATWWNVRTDGLSPDAAVNPALIDLKERLPELPKLLPSLAHRYDLVIVDVPPSAPPFLSKVVEAADMAIIPVRPTTDDLVAVPPTLKLVRPTQTPFAFVLTQVPPGNGGKVRAAEVTTKLARHGRVVGRIGFRVAYSDARATGQATCELTPKDKAAVAEVRELWDLLRDELGLATALQEAT